MRLVGPRLLIRAWVCSLVQSGVRAISIGKSALTLALVEGEGSAAAGAATPTPAPTPNEPTHLTFNKNAPEANLRGHFYRVVVGPFDWSCLPWMLMMMLMLMMLWIPSYLPVCRGACVPSSNTTLT